MPTQLTFPRLPYVKLGLWQLNNKIEWATGHRASFDLKTDTMDLGFSEDLTQEQIDAVNSIMGTADPQGPEVELMLTGNSLVLCDVWEYRHVVASEAGIDYQVRYRHSGNLPGNYYPDEIVIIPTGPLGGTRLLTKQERSAFEDAIYSRNRWE